MTGRELRINGYVVECPECGGLMNPIDDEYGEIWWCCTNVKCDYEIQDEEVD